MVYANGCFRHTHIPAHTHAQAHTHTGTHTITHRHTHANVLWPEPGINGESKTLWKRVQVSNEVNIK